MREKPIITISKNDFNNNQLELKNKKTEYLKKSYIYQKNNP